MCYWRVTFNSRVVFRTNTKILPLFLDTSDSGTWIGWWKGTRRAWKRSRVDPESWCWGTDEEPLLALCDSLRWGGRWMRSRRWHWRWQLCTTNTTCHNLANLDILNHKSLYIHSISARPKDKSNEKGWKRPESKTWYISFVLIKYIQINIGKQCLLLGMTEAERITAASSTTEKLCFVASE